MRELIKNAPTSERRRRFPMSVLLNLDLHVLAVEVTPTPWSHANNVNLGFTLTALDLLSQSRSHICVLLVTFKDAHNS